jgi:hypothetical protein
VTARPRALVDAARALQSFLDGTEDADVLAWLRGGLRAWVSGRAESIPEAFGLPATARGAALVLRNYWLVETARNVPAATPWLQARTLEAEVRAFNRKWAAWCRLSAPPSYATTAQRCLFRAAQLGELPATAERLLAILNEADCRERLVPTVPASGITTNEGGKNEIRTVQPGKDRSRARRRKAATG